MVATCHPTILDLFVSDNHFIAKEGKKRRRIHSLLQTVLPEAKNNNPVLRWVPFQRHFQIVSWSQHLPPDGMAAKLEQKPKNLFFPTLDTRATADLPRPFCLQRGKSYFRWFCISQNRIEGFSYPAWPNGVCCEKSFSRSKHHLESWHRRLFSLAGIQPIYCPLIGRERFTLQLPKKTAQAHQLAMQSVI